MHILENFLQKWNPWAISFKMTPNLSKPPVVAEILQFEIWRVPPFSAKTTILEGVYLQNYSSDFNKIENIGFFI